jgi:hypothetical protein
LCRIKRASGGGKYKKRTMKIIGSAPTTINRNIESVELRINVPRRETK